MNEIQGSTNNNTMLTRSLSIRRFMALSLLMLPFALFNTLISQKHIDSVKLRVRNLHNAVETTAVTANEGSVRNLQELVNQNQIKILSLGGTITKGTNLDNQKQSYPYLMGSAGRQVTYASTRATGEKEMSVCVETKFNNKDYDVILLEFSLSGQRGLKELVDQLRKRYPSATIVYVHLYSLSTDIVDEHGRTPLEQKGMAYAEDFVWGYGTKISDAVYKDVNKLAEKYNFHMYSLPKSKNVAEAARLFSPDWHHLSEEGHQEVAAGIKNVLRNLPQPEERQQKGRFEKNIECKPIQ